MAKAMHTLWLTKARILAQAGDYKAAAFYLASARKALKDVKAS